MGEVPTPDWVIIVLIVTGLALMLGTNFKLFNMANELDALKAAVEAENTVIDSAITLLQGLKTKLDEALSSGDPAKLHELSAEIGSKTDQLAAAVTANTPAE